MKTFFCKYKHLVILLLSAFLASAVVFCCSAKTHASTISDLANTFVQNATGLSDLFWDVSNGTLYYGNQTNSLVIDANRLDNSGSSGGGGGHSFGTPLAFYNSTGSHGGGGASRDGAKVYDSGSTTVRNIVNNLDNSVYNYETNNYETYNTYNSYNDYNFYYTDNYFYAITYEETYYNIIQARVSSPNDLVYSKAYYQLPDGRNSYNLTADDIKGTVFCYDVVNYQKTTTDKNTVGLWHFDSNIVNEVTGRESSTGYGYEFVSGRFNYGYAYPSRESAGSNGSVHLAFGRSGYPNEAVDTTQVMSGTWSVSYWLYAPDDYLQSYQSGSTVYYTCPMRFSGNYITYGAWNYIMYVYSGSSLTNVYVNGSNLGTSYNSEYLRCLDIWQSSNILYGVELANYDYQSGTYKTVGNNLCYLDFDGFVIDEVRVAFGSGDVNAREEPYDLTYAFTVPTSISDTVYTLSDLYTDRETISLPCTIYFTFLTSKGSYTSGDYTYYRGPEIIYNNDSGTGGISFGSNAMNERACSNISSWDGCTVSYYFYQPTSTTIAILITNLDNGEYFYWPNTGAQGYSPSSTSTWDYNYSSPVYAKHYGINAYKTRTGSSVTRSIRTNDIGILSPVTLTTTQIGGVRPNFPTDGYCFINLYNNLCSNIMVWYNNCWNECEGAIYYNNMWNNLTSWDFSKQKLIDDDDDTGTYIYYYSVDNSDNSSVTYIYNYGGSSSVSSNNITISGNDTYDITVEQQTDDDGGKISWFLAIIGSFIAWLGVCINALPLIPTSLKFLLSGLFLSVGALIIWKAVKR